MPSAPSPDQPLAARDDIRRLEEQLAELPSRVERLTHDQEVQFTRIAQMQADFDVIRAAWSKIPSPEAEIPYIGPKRRKADKKR